MIGYIFHPDAAVELEEAAAFYESRMLGLGRFFAAEIEKTISIIREFPDTGALVGASRRGVVVAGFPYSVVYRTSADLVNIIAVAHHRRRPRYWRNRT